MILFFATALSQVLLTLLNAKIIGLFRPRTLIGFGLSLSALAVAALMVSAETSVPMIWVMLAGVVGSLICYLVIARPSAGRAVDPAPSQ